MKVLEAEELAMAAMPTGTRRAQAQFAVARAFGVITQNLRTNREVAVPGFGSFMLDRALEERPRDPSSINVLMFDALSADDPRRQATERIVLGDEYLLSTGTAAVADPPLPIRDFFAACNSALAAGYAVHVRRFGTFARVETQIGAIEPDVPPQEGVAMVMFTPDEELCDELGISRVEVFDVYKYPIPDPLVLRVIVDPGDASAEEITQLYLKLSDLYVSLGGSGLRIIREERRSIAGAEV